MGRNQLPRAEKYCENCGKRLIPRVLATGYLESTYWFNLRRFCNLSCLHAFRTGKSNPKTAAGGRSAARRNFKRKLICADCGRQIQNSEIHHIDKNPLNNSSKNLVELCKGCHEKRHHPPIFCTICGKPHHARGLCNTHYRQLVNAEKRGKELPPLLKQALEATTDA